MANQVTEQWLKDEGFEFEPGFGYVKQLADGPDETTVALTVGNFPRNQACVCLLVAGFALVTSAESQEDILALIRMFNDCFIDHPYIEECDFGEENSD